MATQPVNFFAPGTDAGLDFNQIQRQRDMAAMLMKSGFDPQQGQMVGNQYVAPGAMSYVSQLVGALAGTGMQRNADQAERDLLQRAQTQRAAEASSFMDALNGKAGQPIKPLTANDDEGNPMPVSQSPATAPDRARALAIALQSQNPALQSMGAELMKRQMSEQQLADIMAKYGPGGTGGAGGGGAPGGMPGVNPLAFALSGAGYDKLGSMVQDASKPIALPEGDLVVPDGQGGYRAAYSQPKLPAGMVPVRDASGRVTGASVLPGFTGGTAAIAGAERNAQEAASDAYKPPTLVDLPGGPKLLTPAQQRAMAGGSDASAPPAGGGGPVNGQAIPNPMAPRPGDSDRAMIYAQELKAATGRLQQAQAGGNADEINRAQQDVQGILKEIKSNKIQFPAELMPGAGAGRGGQGGPGIPVQDEASKAYDTARAKDFATQAAAHQKTGQQGAATLRNLDELRTLYADPNVAKGALAENISGLKNVGASFGIDMKGLSSEQASEAITNKMALDLRSTADGGGMPGAMSDSDRNFLKALTPNLTKSPEGRQKIMDAQQKVAQRQIDVARLANDYEQRNGRLDAGFDKVLQDYAAKNTMFTAAKPGGGFKIIGVQ